MFAIKKGYWLKLRPIRSIYQALLDLFGLAVEREPRVLRLRAADLVCPPRVNNASTSVVLMVPARAGVTEDTMGIEELLLVLDVICRCFVAVSVVGLPVWIFVEVRGFLRERGSIE